MAVPSALPAVEIIECKCAACRAGDALPEHLQGIPGAKQLAFVAPAREPALTLHLSKLRAACAGRCAAYGEPPCYEFDNASAWHEADWCKECRSDAGEDVDSDPEPLDPAAVVAPLL